MSLTVLHELHERKVSELQGENDRLREEIRVARSALRFAEGVIARGVELMELKQVSEWEGIRACQEEIGELLERERKPAAPDDRFALIEREIRSMSPETRRRLDELLCRLGETERAKDVTP